MGVTLLLYDLGNYLKKPLTQSFQKQPVCLSTPFVNLIQWHFTDSPYLYEPFQPCAHTPFSTSRTLPTTAPAGLIHCLGCSVCHSSHALSPQTRLCHSGQLPPFTVMDCIMQNLSGEGSGPTSNVCLS